MKIPIKSLILCFLLLPSLISQCNADYPNIRIIKIKYVFYTVKSLEDLSNINPIQGKELTKFNDPAISPQPDAFDVTIVAKIGFNKRPETSIKVSFYFSIANEIFDKDHIVDIDRMYNTSSWTKVWDKTIVLSNLKSNETREVIVDRVKIDEIEEQIYTPKNQWIMGWKCIATCGGSTLERKFIRSFLD